MSAPPRFTDRPDWFRQETLGDGIFRVTEPLYREDYRCNIYVLQGSSQDIVLDTGLGLASLREFLKPLTADPLLVSSHGHYDHIGSNWEFSSRVIHPAEADIVARPNRENTLANLLLATEDFYGLPWPGYDARDWQPLSAPATGFLEDGDVLDLGARQLRVLHTPGHSWGSISLWDEVNAVLFCADAVYAGELFDALPCSDVATYVQTMRRLHSLPVRVAYPGHGPALSGDEFQQIVQGYLDCH